MNKVYTLINAQGKPYESTEKGTIGGHNKLRQHLTITHSQLSSKIPPQIR